MLSLRPIVTWVRSRQGRWTLFGIVILAAGLAVQNRSYPRKLFRAAPAIAQRAQSPHFEAAPPTETAHVADVPRATVTPTDRPAVEPPTIHHPPVEEPATPEQRALFAPLVAGARVGPATVVRFEGLRDGFLRVHTRLVGGRGEVAVVVARLQGSNAHPPVTAGSYALYYTTPSVPYPVVEQVLRAVGLTLAGRGSDTIPGGLRPMVVPDPTR